jgi:glyoxylase-like metal-dependent hydrolase (beta-lactamase superfamily II)
MRLSIFARQPPFIFPVFFRTILCYTENKGGTQVEKDTVTALPLAVQNGTIYPALLYDGETLFLVDSGFPGQFSDLCAAIESAGFSPDDIDAIVFTHQDLDHIGTAKTFKEAYPNITMICHSAERERIDGTKMPIKLEQRLQNVKDEAEKREVEEFISRTSTLSVAIDRTVEDGEAIGCADAVAILIPGHTMGHICIYIPSEKLLIAGDALNIAEGGSLTGPNPVHTLDIALATESLQKLKEYDIDKVLCYHGGLYEGDVAAAIDAIL